MNDTNVITNCKHCGVFIYSDEDITVCSDCLSSGVEDHNGA